MRLTEQIITEGADFSEEGLIKGVVISRLKSKNNREYTEGAFREALHLYEGRAVYLNHAKGQRDVESRFGKLENCRMEDNLPKADLRHLATHPLASRIREDMQRGLGCFGLSHHIDGKGYTKDGVTHVEKIARVRSVDIVSEPATTMSLTEQESDDMDKILESLQALLATEGLTKEQFLAGCEQAWDTTFPPAAPEEPAPMTEQIKALQEQVTKQAAELASVKKLGKYVKPRSADVGEITEQTAVEIPKDKKEVGKWLRSAR